MQTPARELPRTLYWRSSQNSLLANFGEHIFQALRAYTVFCGFYRARSWRRNSREVAVSNVASPHISNARTARVIREGTDIATGMRTQQGIVTTNLGTLTLPSSRSLKALCPRR